MVTMLRWRVVAGCRSAGPSHGETSPRLEEEKEHLWELGRCFAFQFACFVDKGTDSISEVEDLEDILRAVIA